MDRWRIGGLTRKACPFPGFGFRLWRGNRFGLWLVRRVLILVGAFDLRFSAPSRVGGNLVGDKRSRHRFSGRPVELRILFRRFGRVIGGQFRCRKRLVGIDGPAGFGNRCRLFRSKVDRHRFFFSF